MIGKGGVSAQAKRHMLAMRKHFVAMATMHPDLAQVATRIERGQGTEADWRRVTAILDRIDAEREKR